MPTYTITFPYKALLSLCVSNTWKRCSNSILCSLRFASFPNKSLLLTRLLVFESLTLSDQEASLGSWLLPIFFKTLLFNILCLHSDDLTLRCAPLTLCCAPVTVHSSSVLGCLLWGSFNQLKRLELFGGMLFTGFSFFPFQDGILFVVFTSVFLCLDSMHCAS